MESKEVSRAGARTVAHLVGFLFKVVIPIVILVAALGLAKYQMDTSRKARRQKPSRQAKLVTVLPAERTDIRTTVYAMGTVLPAQQVTLAPQVSGRIVALGPNVIPGGLVKADESLVVIDSRDYEFAIQQRGQDVAQAQLNLKLEQGNQAVAKAEYNLLGELVSQEDRNLVLREPHLKRAEAALEAAKATLGQAVLNRDRCTIGAPFNGIVQEKLADVGATVSPSSRLLTLVGTDEYWIEVLVPVNELQWIDIPGEKPDDGSLVRVYDKSQWGPETYREGRVIRLLPNLETAGRMARVLVRVMDPLSLSSPGRPNLLIGSFVRLEIVGRMLSSIIPVSRDHLRDGDRVWIMNGQDRLEIRPVQIAFRDKFTVYVRDGLEVGERIVVTDIGAPVDDMPLRLESDAPPPSPSADVSAAPTQDRQEKSL